MFLVWLNFDTERPDDAVSAILGSPATAGLQPSMPMKAARPYRISMLPGEESSAPPNRCQSRKRSARF